MARPTTYDEARGRAVLGRMMLGDSRRDAAKAAGVCLRTLQGWLARGRAEARRGDQGPLAGFARRFDRVAEARRRAAVEAWWGRHHARASERWRRFKAARERWWLE